MDKKDLIWGIHSIEEALDKSIPIFKVFVNKNSSNTKINTLLKKFKIAGIPVQKVPNEKLNKFTRKNHQGIVAVVSPIEFQQIENLLPLWFEQGKQPLVVVPDGVSDVRNFGAIVRSAVCMNANAIIIPSTGSASINSDTVKTSAGAIFKIPVCRTNSLYNTVKYLKNSGLQIMAATEKGTTQVNEADLTAPTAIIMGDEGKGVSNQLLKISDFWIKIPMAENFDSLNVSVSAGIILYEAFIQRKAIE